MVWNGLFCHRGPAQVGVENDPGGIDDGPQGGPEPLPQRPSQLRLQSRQSRLQIPVGVIAPAYRLPQPVQGVPDLLDHQLPGELVQQRSRAQAMQYLVYRRDPAQGLVGGGHPAIMNQER